MGRDKDRAQVHHTQRRNGKYRLRGNELEICHGQRYLLVSRLRQADPTQTLPDPRSPTRCTRTRPPPSSPQSSNVRRTTTSGPQRQRGGFVQGTGRVKPNGSIERADSKPQAPPIPAAPVKLCTVIDQGPTPLYCADECQMADLNRAIPHNFNPQRSSTSSPDSFSSSDSIVSSIESQSSVESAPPTTPMSPSLATLAAIYNFPPLPPPAPIDEDDTPVPCRSPNEYCSGIMMAARYIASELCAKSQKRGSYGHLTTSTEPRQPIPGWTDGSNAWRAIVYSITPPDSSTRVTHNSFATRSSRAVQSILTHSAPRAQTSASLPTHAVSESDAELLTQFSQSFRRNSGSSTCLSTSPAPLSTFPSSSSSFPMTPPQQKRERSLLKRGAEGKLLVPQVMMRVNSGTSSASPLSQRSTSSRSTKSPRSRANWSNDEDDRTQRCDGASSLPQTIKRPTVESRSWSYDNIKTYPIMRLPPKTRIEKRKEKRIVDGAEVEVEVDVEVQIEEKVKRLFLFSAPTTVPV
ncbi:hypothetical protein LshimejAT787_3200040 [Lyophyllum shimeji]|uniref:Uncharacterized protein n=1 Tax=Lyophyllum shimeji TaxID=47721 RepID=A0A9P3UUP4_LYOSH|nr:hypothetical protein LshimejAT787_3200040 [Lyophyllum shimeji]